MKYGMATRKQLHVINVKTCIRTLFFRARNKTNFPAQIRADTPVPDPSPDGSLCSIALPPNHLTYGTPLRRIVWYKMQNANIFGSLAPLARNHLWNYSSFFSSNQGYNMDVIRNTSINYVVSTNVWLTDYWKGLYDFDAKPQKFRLARFARSWKLLNWE